MTRLVNNAIAAVIAQRERQATLAILRSMTDRELRDAVDLLRKLEGDIHQTAKHWEQQVHRARRILLEQGLRDFREG